MFTKDNSDTSHLRKLPPSWIELIQQTYSSYRIFFTKLFEFVKIETLKVQILSSDCNKFLSIGMKTKE